MPLQQIIQDSSNSYLPMEIAGGIVLSLILAIIILARKGHFPELKKWKINTGHLASLIAVVCCVVLLLGIAAGNFFVILATCTVLIITYYSDAFQNTEGMNVVEYEDRNPVTYTSTYSIPSLLRTDWFITVIHWTFLMRPCNSSLINTSLFMQRLIIWIK